MTYSAVNGKIYNPQNLQNLDREEIQYLQCFQKLASVFNQQDYEIWIKREDYDRMLFVGVVNQHSQVAVKIYLKYACVPIDDPINVNVLQTAINHFQSGVQEDLVLNHRV
ncbi:hypothetical protein ACF3DV_06795 [Chlorogloeopsis fritschii PCC 9212]|nr:hypothetical protein [Chlorogloeopsis fritschii]